MTKSRMALLITLASVAAPGRAQPPTAEQVIAAQQAQLRAAVARPCPPQASGDDIVVCAQRPGIERYRAPLPEPPHPGTREQAGGAQLAAMESGDDRCSTVGRNQQCGGVDLLGAALAVVGAIIRAIEEPD